MADLFSPTLPLQRLLFLRIPNQHLPYQQPLPPPHLIHIAPRDILPVRQFAQILEFIFGKRHPERIFIQHLEPSEAQLRTRRARRPFADLVAEAERLSNGEQRADGKCLVSRRGRRGRGRQGFRQNGAAAAREDGVDAAEDVGGGLDLARVHGEEHARGPVEEAGMDGGAHGFDDFAGEAAAVLGGFVVRDGEGHVFEEDGDALDGLGAAGALGGGELEGVGDGGGEGVGGDGAVGGGFGVRVWGG